MASTGVTQGSRLYTARMLYEPIISATSDRGEVIGDLGAAWGLIGSFDVGRVYNILPDPNAADSVIVLGTSSARVSNDGARMTPFLSGQRIVYSLINLPSASSWLAGTDSGLYSSADLSEPWASQSKGLPSGPIYSLAQNGDQLFAGTVIGMYRSLDRGSNWNPVSLDVPVKRLYGISSVAPSGRQFAAIGSSLLASSNRWASTEYVSLPAPTNDFDILSVSQGISGELLVAARYLLESAGNVISIADGFYTSRDGGASWVDQSDKGYVSGMAFAPSRPATAYLVGTNGLQRSIDGGASWMSIPAPVDYSNGPMVLAVSGQNADLLAVAAGKTLSVTRDGGVSWTSTEYPESLRRIYFDPGMPSTLYLATTKTVYKSPDFGRTPLAIFAAQTQGR